MLIVVCFVTIASCLTACSSKVSGTYTSEGLVRQSFTFKPNDVVIMSAFGINAEGTYKIQDNKITVTYKIMNLSYDWTQDFEKKGKSIFINGVEFIKE